VCGKTREHKATEGAETTRKESGAVVRTIAEGYDNGSKDMKALLFLENSMETTSQVLFDDSSKFPRRDTSSKGSDDMVMFCALKKNSDSSTLIPALFYRNAGIVPKGVDWLQRRTLELEGMLVLYFSKTWEYRSTPKNVREDKHVWVGRVSILLPRKKRDRS
jgi:hypothetical protein